MRYSVIEYASKNGFRYHHSISSKENEKEQVLTRNESHYLYELFYLKSGDVQYSANGKTYNVNSGDVFLIAPEIFHSLAIDLTNVNYERAVLHFSADLLPRFFDVAFLDSMPADVQLFPRKLVEKSNIPRIIDEIEKICPKESRYRDLHLYEQILLLIEELDILMLKLTTTDSYVSNSIITNQISYACIQYVQKNLHKNFSLIEIAKKLNISVSYLVHTFKKQIGIPLNRYIILQKMRLAQKLLEQGQSPQQVALTLGYEYYSTFYHQYIKYYGISPSEQLKAPHTRNRQKQSYKSQF